ncbi:MAG TPA: hypothetical protein VLZ81_15775 [Blastocatellia bacterium]|nr:hypothetical protein [Blastocatellia bacterium]
MKRKTATSLLTGMAVAGGAVATYAYLIRPWHLGWGATSFECNETLPGDELVPRPDNQATHAITINAAPEDVWPWIVQVGQTRGGFYSYTWLENMVGCRMRNADRIVPEWQNLEVDDQVWLHPKAPPLYVVALEPLRAIVLGNSLLEPGSDGGADVSGTWGFFLKRIDDRTTRLLARNRWVRRSGLLDWLSTYVVLEPAHFVMERKMLLGIKGRVEGAAGS